MSDFTADSTASAIGDDGCVFTARRAAALAAATTPTARRCFGRRLRHCDLDFCRGCSVARCGQRPGPWRGPASAACRSRTSYPSHFAMLTAPARPGCSMSAASSMQRFDAAVIRSARPPAPPTIRRAAAPSRRRAALPHLVRRLRLCDRTPTRDGDFTGDSRKTYGGVAGVGATVAPGFEPRHFRRSEPIQHQRDGVWRNAGASTSPRSARSPHTKTAPGISTPRWSAASAMFTAAASTSAARPRPSYQARSVGGDGRAQLLLGAARQHPSSSPSSPSTGCEPRTDAFTEIGGTTSDPGSAVTASRVRMLIGGELGHSWLVDRRIMDISVYGALSSTTCRRTSERCI